MYELAEQKGNYFCNINDGGDTITLDGFHLTLLEPLRRWRINFNGMLRYYSEEVVQLLLETILYRIIFSFLDHCNILCIINSYCEF